MPRFFIAGTNKVGGIAVITGADADHIKVLRMKPGEQLVICDGEGREYDCRLTKLSDGIAEAEVCSEMLSPAEPSVRCVVLAAFPKGDKAEYIVQKCTENGASEIVFFPSKRCIARPDNRSIDKKLQRWQRIAEEAAKQSGRGIIPTVRAAADYGEALDIAIKQDLKLFLYEAGERTPICSAVAQQPDAKSCAVITGPEGGFEPYEVEMAAKIGFTICSMGPRILRCETAPLVALTAVLCQTGNL